MINRGGPGAIPDLETRTIEVDSDSVGQRLDLWLARRLSPLSRHQVQLELKKGRIKVNAQERPARYRLREGDTIEVATEPPSNAPKGLTPFEQPLSVAMEDDDLLVVDKPVGMVAHPAPGHTKATLAQALLAHVGPGIEHVGGPSRCGLVHRLDRMTSGLIIAAKTQNAFDRLTEAQTARRIEKRYLGVALGHFRETSGEIDKPVGRRGSDRKKMGIVKGGRQARTSYRVLLQAPEVALLLLRLHTGRTHQIRVHLQSIGRPVLGDVGYGWTKRHSLSLLAGDLRSKLGPIWPKGQLLHAAGLRFDHPTSGDAVELTRMPPEKYWTIAETIFGAAPLDLEDILLEDMRTPPETEEPEED